MALCSPNLLLLSLLLLSTIFTPSLSQPAATPNVDCNGILLSYNLNSRRPIRPNSTDPTHQAYAFSATATLLNSGTLDLTAWSLLVSYSHGELLVSVDNAVISSSSADSSSFPFNTTGNNPVAFSGFPNPDLKTPISTAGDQSQIQTDIQITGTLFAPPTPFAILPTSFSLADPSYNCPTPRSFPSSNSNSNSTFTCCVKDPNFKPNSTTDVNSTVSPRLSGDLVISYDVLQAFSSSYLASVTIDNESPLGRLDNWRLSWEWQRDEFIYSMKGAYPSLTDPATCIFGAQGQFYKDLDFSKVVSCQKRPVILDLPLSKFNDTDVGRIPNCCRNGTILPSLMDPSQSSSAFQLQVFKMPPDLNRTKLYPPQNWNITGAALNPDFRCGQPIRVSPAQFPDPSGLQSSTTSVASWQVVCNITKPKGSSPKCCVSFSSFYNDSVVPCKTCACGCPAGGLRQTCNATAPALLLPSEALLVPFDNRTTLARAFAANNRYSVPSTLPCGDFCGVSINWHVNADYRKGWSARVTLFNWDDTSFADWFAAVELSKAYDGFEAMYSFNGTSIGNSTIFMQGLPGLNYLAGEVDGADPNKDPRVPGKQQSVISFTKKDTPGINVVAGDGFPSKVYFNGEECSLPETIPTSGGFRSGVGGGVFGLVVFLAVTALLLLEQ